MIGVQEWRRVKEPEQTVNAEAELLRAGRAGDGVALERLFASYTQGLHGLCRGMLGGSNDDADDAVQETFYRALRSLPAFRGDASVRTWLVRIAINVCFDAKRRQNSRPATAPIPDGAATNALTPEAEVLRQMRVREALATLPPPQRAVLLLKELEGWSLAEIAAAMGWNTKKVENALFAARRTLADWRRREAEGDRL